MEEQNKEEVKVETPIEPKQENNNGHKALLWFLIVLIVLLMGVGGFFAYKYFTNKDDKETDKPVEEKEEKKDEEKKDEQEDPQEQEEEKEDEPENPPTPVGEYETTIYLYDDAKQVCGFKKDESCNRILATIKTETKNPKLVAVTDGALFVLYDDNGLKIYDSTKKTVKNTNLKYIEYNEYSVILNENKTAVMGLGYTDTNNYLVYYNVLTNKKMYENKYKANGNAWFSEVNNKTVSLTNEHIGYLLSVEEEKELRSKTLDEYSYPQFEGHGTNGNYFYILGSSGPGGFEPREVYDKNNKLILGNTKRNILYDFKDDYLYISDGAKILKYNSDGKILYTSRVYESNTEQIARNYVIYLKNNSYFLENIEDPNEVKEVVKFNKDKSYYDHFTSGYYSRKDLDNLDETDKPEGIYIVIVYYEKDANGNYGMEYCYNVNTKQIQQLPIKEEVGGRAKPVLYLYPKKDTNVKVEFAHPEYLTTTYPKYNKSWNVLAKPNGDLYDESGKYYYALYWDEKRYNEVDFSEGFYVEGKDAIKFLEEKLSIIGLNDRERNEFIMYWLPMLENNKKSLVYFELTKERESGNKLNITPTPDSMLRVSIHIKKVNNKVNIKEQKLETFKRTGFTVVEWGGMTY